MSPMPLSSDEIAKGEAQLSHLTAQEPTAKNRPQYHNTVDLKCEGEPSTCLDAQGRPIDGVVATFDEEDGLLRLAHYRQGQAHGWSISFYGGLQLYFSRDIVKWIVNYENGRQSGLAIQFHEETPDSPQALSINEKLKWVVPFVQGQPQGLRRGYYEDGSLKSETMYKNGREDGGLYEFYENGSLKFEEKYEDGKKIGPRREYALNAKAQTPAPWTAQENQALMRLTTARAELVAKAFDILDANQYEVFYRDNGFKSGGYILCPTGRLDICREEKSAYLENPAAYHKSGKFVLYFGHETRGSYAVIRNDGIIISSSPRVIDGDDMESYLKDAYLSWNVERHDDKRTLHIKVEGERDQIMLEYVLAVQGELLISPTETLMLAK